MRQTLFETCVDMVWTQSSKVGLFLFSLSRARGKGSQSSTCCFKLMMCLTPSMWGKESGSLRGLIS
jgi:hypothetical protein